MPGGGGGMAHSPLGGQPVARPPPASHRRLEIAECEPKRGCRSVNRRDFPRVRSDFRERPRNKTERKAGGLRCGARRRREAGGGGGIYTRRGSVRRMRPRPTRARRGNPDGRAVCTISQRVRLCVKTPVKTHIVCVIHSIKHVKHMQRCSPQQLEKKRNTRHTLTAWRNQGCIEK